MNELAPRPSLHDRTLYGLVSLWWIMRRIDISALIELERIQERVQQILRLEAENKNKPRNALLEMMEPPTDVGSPFVGSILKQMSGISSSFGLTQTKKQLARAEISPPKTDRELGMLYNVMMDELDDHKFYWIESEKSSYWENSRLLSDEAKAAFPEVADEVRNAGTAYACDLPVSSVFHSMRAAETGLRIVAGALGVTVTGDENMKNVVDGIEKAARALDNVQRHPNKSSDSQFYSEIALDAGLMKDAWRNHVAHAKSSYSDKQAVQVLDTVCRLFNKLSGRFNQHSTPSAP